MMCFMHEFNSHGSSVKTYSFRNKKKTKKQTKRQLEGLEKGHIHSCMSSSFPPFLSISLHFFNSHLNLSAHRCGGFSAVSPTSHSRPACQRPLRAEGEGENVLMNPLREQRVHLSGNPIKSQGEMLLCLQLIIGSLPCVEAAAPFPEVDGDGTVG